LISLTYNCVSSSSLICYEKSRGRGERKERMDCYDQQK